MDVPIPVAMAVFLIVTFFTPKPMPGLDREMAVGAVVLVLTIIKLRLVPPLLLPSIVTLDAPFNFIRAPLATDPVRVAVTAAAGLISSVNVPEVQPILAVVFRETVPDSAS